MTEQELDALWDEADRLSEESHRLLDQERWDQADEAWRRSEEIRDRIDSAHEEHTSSHHPAWIDESYNHAPIGHIETRSKTHVLAIQVAAVIAFILLFVGACGYRGILEGESAPSPCDSPELSAEARSDCRDTYGQGF